MQPTFRRGDTVEVMHRYAMAFPGMVGRVMRVSHLTGQVGAMVLVNFGVNLTGQRLNVRIPDNSLRRMPLPEPYGGRDE